LVPPLIGDSVEQHRVVGVELHHRRGIHEVVDSVIVECDAIVSRVVDVFVPTNLDGFARLVVRDVARSLPARFAARTGLEDVRPVP
jgi:hypothetical protein